MAVSYVQTNHTRSLPRPATKPRDRSIALIHLGTSPKPKPRRTGIALNVFPGTRVALPSFCRSWALFYLFKRKFLLDAYALENPL